MAIAQAKHDAVEAMIAAYAVPVQGKWLSQARSAALVRLRAAGAPHRRDEYWRFSNPESLVVHPALSAALFVNDEEPMFGDVERLKLVFLDGVFDAAQSDDMALEGIEIERLSKAGDKDIHWAKDLYGVLESNGQTPVKRPLAALNTAVATDGLVIRVTGKVSKPVAIDYLHADETSDVVLHHVIKLERGADLTLLECGPAAARLNKVVEVEIADGAAFHHVRTQGRDHERRAATHIFARLGNESGFKSFTLSANGRLTRNECVIELNGDDSHATVSGAAVGDGGEFVHDDTVFITHDAVNCESRQVFKKVLRNGATGVFQGKILVQPGAQKTDGYQISQALLLDEDSNFLVKPELEIYADDVACSHGSTCGAIDETALFYLTSRGIRRAQAQDMLTLAFLGEAIEEIEDNDIAEDIRNRLAAWMERRHG